MTKTPRWLRSVLAAAEEQTPKMTFERDNRPALEIRRDGEEPADRYIRAKA